MAKKNKVVKSTKKKITKKDAKVVAKKDAKKEVKNVAKKAAKKITKKTESTKTASVKKQAVAGKTLLGTTIGAFSVLNAQGNTYTQNDLKGHKTVLYFYPKDDTPGCTLEGQQFTSLKTAFDGHNTTILGVSKDSVESHDKFICKYGLKIDLLSDENEKLCNLFDVIKEKNMYGRKYMGIERSTFVIDENLKVIKEMRKVSPNGHAQEILDFLKSL